MSEISSFSLVGIQRERERERKQRGLEQHVNQSTLLLGCSSLSHHQYHHHLLDCLSLFWLAYGNTHTQLIYLWRLVKRYHSFFCLLTLRSTKWAFFFSLSRRIFSTNQRAHTDWNSILLSASLQKNVSAPTAPPIKRVQSERFPSLCTVGSVET